MKKATFLTIIISFLFPLSAHAEDALCAAVLPCTEDGGVMEEFQGSPCESQYRIQCLRYSSATLNSDLSACIDAQSELSSKQLELDRQISILKSKLRAAKRGRGK